jgi:hypothetical protein
VETNNDSATVAAGPPRPADAEECAACREPDVIVLRCAKCGRAIGAECALDSELSSGKCLLCMRPKSAGAQRRRRY